MMFKFKMNNVEWIIRELSQKEIKLEQNRRNANNEENVNDTASLFFGVTWHDKLEIYLDKDLPVARKRKTLIHELTHCYISSYITHQEKTYDEEMVADIVSNSHDIICGIVEKYFNRKVRK